MLKNLFNFQFISEQDFFYQLSRRAGGRLVRATADLAARSNHTTSFVRLALPSPACPGRLTLVIASLFCHLGTLLSNDNT